MKARRVTLGFVLLAACCALAVPAQAKAPAVCGQLTTAKIAAQKHRVAYLTKLLPAARHAGFGIGPLLTLEVAALKAKNRAAAAHYLTLLGNACKRAS